jgi:chromosome segregation ATPase
MKKNITAKKAIVSKKEKNDYVTRGELVILLKEQTKEINRNSGALLEEFQSRTSAIAEHLVGLNDKMNLNTEMIGTLMVDMTEVKEKVDVLTEDMTEVKEKVDILTDDMIEVKEKVGILTEDMTEVKGKLDVLSNDMSIVKENIEIIKTDVKKKVDHEEFSMLERRVSFIESKIRV